MNLMATRKIAVNGSFEVFLGQANQAGCRQKPQTQFRFFQPSLDFNPSSAVVKRPKARQAGRARKKDPAVQAEKHFKENRFLDAASIYLGLGRNDSAHKCATAAESDGYYVEAAKIYNSIGKRDLAVALAAKLQDLGLKITLWEVYRELGMRVEAAKLFVDKNETCASGRRNFGYDD